MTDDLLTEEELTEARAEAERILSQPTREYSYRDPDYRGGPRNVDSDDLVAAALELTTVRVMVEEFDDRAAEARIQRLERCAELLDAGIPVDFIAKHSGLKHRSSVYRDVKKIPEMRAARAAAQKIRAGLDFQE